MGAIDRKSQHVPVRLLDLCLQQIRSVEHKTCRLRSYTITLGSASIEVCIHVSVVCLRVVVDKVRHEFGGAGVLLWYGCIHTDPAIYHNGFICIGT